jgi:hypothetical protein
MSRDICELCPELRHPLGHMGVQVPRDTQEDGRCNGARPGALRALAGSAGQAGIDRHLADQLLGAQHRGGGYSGCHSRWHCGQQVPGG